MEAPQVAEFEVYMDIDGAVEEDEDSVPSEGGVGSAQPPESGEQSQCASLPLQDPETAGDSRPSDNTTNNTTASSLAPEGVSAPSKRSHAVHGHDSDNEEVDVDTPYDGKLFGQTRVKNEPSNQHNLLSTLLSFTALSGSSTSAVPNKPATPKKVAVARKSTTQRKFDSTGAAKNPVFLQKDQQQSLTQRTPLWPPHPQKGVNRVASNVAKKSTSKQPRLATSSFSAKAASNKAKTGNILQVKFGHEKYLAKAKAHASFKNMPRAPAITKKPAPLWRKAVQGMPRTYTSSTMSRALPSVSSNAGKKVFPCCERSGDRISCPECNIVVKTYCLRSHLKTVHNLPMKNCKKCRITFTDLNLFSEHYAHHLQEQEDGSDIQPSPKHSKAMPLPLGFQAGSSKTAVARKQPSSTVTSDSGDFAESFREVSSESDEMNFSDHPRSPPSVKKRKPSFPPGPLPKLGHEFQLVENSDKVPFYPKLPPKPRKPSFQPKKRPFFGGANRAVSGESSLHSAASNTLTVPAKPKLPAKPRKPFSPSKMRTLYPPASRVFSSESVESGSPRGRSTSSESRQSEELSSSEVSAVGRPTFYTDNRKTAIRRKMGVPNPQVLPPSKKARPDIDAAAAPVARKSRGKATVSLVSLETASRPYDCKKCLAAFHVALQCPRAFRLHSQSKPYTCTNRPASFSRREQLHTHQDTDYGSVPAKSEDSDNDDASLHSSLRRHRTPSSSGGQELEQNVPEKGYGKGLLFQCQKCKESFQYRSVLLRHLSYHSYQYCCGVCKKAFKLKVDLLDHLQIMHDGRLLLRCKYCERRFEDMAEFERHNFSHKDGTVVPCTKCNKTFSSSRQMQVHLTVEHGVTQNCVSCRVCGKRFKNAKVLSIHLRVAHRTRMSVACQVCGRRFKQAKYLSLHMKSAHSTTKPAVTKNLSCRVCQKVFLNTSGLGAHLRLRHGLKSVPMPEESVPDPQPVPSSSQAQTRVPSSSVQPKTINCALNSTTCEVCGKKYTKRKVLVSHYRHIHKMEPPGMEGDAIKCQLCGKLVYSLQGLKVHYRVRHRRKAPEPPVACEDSKPATSATTTATRATATPATGTTGTSLKGRCRCGICGKFFLYNWSLFRHQRLYHRNAAKGLQRTKPNPVQTRSDPVQTKLNPVQAKPNPVQAKPNLVQTKPNPGKESTADQYIKASLKVNRFTCKKKRGWLCPICSKSFVLRKTMRMHVKAEHPKNFKDERFGGRKCPKCMKDCGSKTKLFIHLKTCGLQPRAVKNRVWNLTNRLGDFKCMMCEKKFRWKQSLIRHMQVHHKLSKEVIVYNMTHLQLAESGKSHSLELKSENQPSSGLKFYLCEVCKVCFTAKRSLMRHVQRRHSGLTYGFQCRYRPCKKLFLRNDALIDHIKTAHPQMSVYSCLSCSTGFGTKDDLFRHICFNNRQSSAPASSSWHDQEDYAQEGGFDPLSAEQECRYRCITCDMGFHIAREWTRHMQQHVENQEEFSEDVLKQEQVMEATDTVRLSIFDVMSSSSVLCKFCNTIFKDENEVNHHVCEQPAAALSGPKKGKRKGKSRRLAPVKNRNFVPVKCTVCLKLFSPLSIKKHMKNIHSLPMKICNICNIVFTDLERFRRHDEFHKQQERRLQEEEAVIEPVEDEHNEESVTFFICQICGGLFSDKESLDSHVCTGEEGEEMAVSQPGFEDNPYFDGQEDLQGRSSETDLSKTWEYSRSASQSTDDTDSYTESNHGSAGGRENQTSLYDNASGFDDHPGIVIESVTGGVTVEPDTFDGREVSGSNREETMEMGDENEVREQLVPSQSLSFDDVLLDSPPETVPSPHTAKLNPSQNGSHDAGSESLQELQSGTDHILSTTEYSSYDMPESGHLKNVDNGAVISGAAEIDMEIDETTPSNHFAGMGDAIQYETGEGTRYEEPDNDLDKNIPFEAVDPRANYTGPSEETEVFSVDLRYENVLPTNSADGLPGMVGDEEEAGHEQNGQILEWSLGNPTGGKNPQETFHQVEEICEQQGVFSVQGRLAEQH